MSASEDKKPESLGAFSISNALHHLFEAAAPNLSNEQLELLERATLQAEIEAQNMSDIIENIGALMAHDAEDDVGSREQMPTLLYQISYSFDAIAGMIQLGSSAKHRLQNPDQYSATKQEGAA
jgi:hypothetical protein